MDITSLLVSGASGGLLGLLGSVSSGIMGFFQKKQDYAFELERLKLTSSLRQGELAGELAKAREQGAADAFTASINAEGRLKGEWKWVTSLRAFTRPGLTWHFTYAELAIVFMHLFGIFDVMAVTDPIIQFGIMTVFTSASMMQAWWFGQRSMDKAAIFWGNKDTGATVSSKK